MTTPYEGLTPSENPTPASPDTEPRALTLTDALRAPDTMARLFSEVSPEIMQLTGKSVRLRDNDLQHYDFMTYMLYETSEAYRKNNFARSEVIDILWTKAKELGWVSDENDDEIAFSLERGSLQPEVTLREWRIQEAIFQEAGKRKFKETYPEVSSKEYNQLASQISTIAENLQYFLTMLQDGSILPQADIQRSQSLIALPVRDQLLSVHYRIEGGKVVLEERFEEGANPKKPLIDSPEYATSEIDRELLRSTLKHAIQTINETPLPEPFTRANYLLSLRQNFTAEYQQWLREDDIELNHLAVERLQALKEAFAPDSDLIYYLQFAKAKSAPQLEQFLAKWLAEGNSLAEILTRTAHGADLQYESRQTSHPIGGVAVLLSEFLTNHRENIKNAFSTAGDGFEISDEDLDQSIQAAIRIAVRVAEVGATLASKEFGSDGFGPVLAGRHMRNVETMHSMAEKLLPPGSEQFELESGIEATVSNTFESSNSENNTGDEDEIFSGTAFEQAQRILDVPAGAVREMRSKVYKCLEMLQDERQKITSSLVHEPMINHELAEATEEYFKKMQDLFAEIQIRFLAIRDEQQATGRPHYGSAVTEWMSACIRFAFTPDTDLLIDELFLIDGRNKRGLGDFKSQYLALKNEYTALFDMQLSASSFNQERDKIFPRLKSLFQAYIDDDKRILQSQAESNQQRGWRKWFRRSSPQQETKEVPTHELVDKQRLQVLLDVVNQLTDLRTHYQKLHDDLEAIQNQQNLTVHSRRRS